MSGSANNRKNGTPVLKAENLGITFGGLHAVSGFDLEMYEGELVGLIGPNGAGKTTIFNLLTGVYQPTEGNFYLHGKSMLGKKPHQMVEEGIARTFQNIRLFGNLTVFENVLIAKHMRAKQNVFSATFRLNRKEEERMRREAMELLELQGMAHLRDEIASSLPYGLQRRVEIARALATDPTLLLLDEPAAGMNPQETQELTDFIVQIKDQYHLSVFMIEHHMDLVMQISQRIYVLDFGKLIAQGSAKEVQNNPEVIKAYLGVADNA